MLSILKVLYDFCFLLFRLFILSDEVVVHSVIHFKTLQFPKWWKVFCKALQTWINLIYGRSSKVKQQFVHRRMWFCLTNLEQNTLFVTSPASAFILRQKYKTENLLLKRFSNFKLQKHRRIFLFYLRKRIRINDKIFNIVLFSLTSLT